MPKSLLLLCALSIIFASCKKEPIANYSIEVLNCTSPYDVQFTNESTNANEILWKINGLYYTEQNPTVSIEAGEMSNVELLVENGRHQSRRANDFLPEWYYYLPKSNFSNSFPNCQNYLQVKFHNSSDGNIDEYLWDFGDGNFSSSQNPTHVFSTQGSHSIKLSVIRCEDTITRVRSVNLVPGNVFPHSQFIYSEGPNQGAGSDILLGHYLKFHNQSNHSSSYLWDFGNGVTSTEHTPTYTYPYEGYYEVSLTSSCNGNSHTSTKMINVDRPDKLHIKSVTLGDFDEENGSEEWDYDPDTEVAQTELRPDVYIKIMQGSSAIFTSSVRKNQAPGSVTWNVNKTVTNLTTEYDVLLYDQDSGSDELMSECSYKPTNFCDYGKYPNSISVGDSNTEITLSVRWE